MNDQEIRWQFGVSNFITITFFIFLVLFLFNLIGDLERKIDQQCTSTFVADGDKE